MVDDDEEDVEDIGGMDGTPSSSTANLYSKNFLDDVIPLGLGSVSHSVSGDFAQPNRNLDISDFEHLNISERPSSTPMGRSGSSMKRRRVASANTHSPLGRLGLNDDWLRCLEEKIEEHDRQRVKMER